MAESTTCRVVYADGTPCGRPPLGPTRTCKACQEWSRRNGKTDPQGRALSAKQPGSGRKTCTVIEDGERCTDLVSGDGKCIKHYKRWKKHGDPLGGRGKRPNGSILEAIHAAAKATTDDCIILTSSSGGRPRTVLDGVSMFASRAVWVVAVGDPGDAHVRHTCNGGSGESGCINIRHLVLGDNAENMQDKVDAGRQVWGEAHHKHLLTEGDVEEVLRRYTPRDPVNGGRALAREFGVTPSTISCIVREKTWTMLGKTPS